MNVPSGVSGAPIDIKDPRIRITFPDVAMRIARDGPMYGIIILVGVLAAKGITTGMESIVGAALGLQARSHPPDDSKATGRLPFIGGAAVVLGSAHFLSGCM